MSVSDRTIGEQSIPEIRAMRMSVFCSLGDAMKVFALQQCMPERTVSATSDECDTVAWQLVGDGNVGMAVDAISMMSGEKDAVLFHSARKSGMTHTFRFRSVAPEVVPLDHVGMKYAYAYTPDKKEESDA